MKNLKLFILAFLTAATAKAADNIHTDPLKDVDHDLNICNDLQTDMIQNNFSAQDDKYVVTMTMSKNVQSDFGYKEYYFWVDVDPTRRKGYQPYDPESVAWPNMYADYRIMLQLDANNDEHKAYPAVKIQNCTDSDCSQDGGLHYADDVKVEIQGPNVIFTWPKTMIPEMAAASTLRVGYTTYYDYSYCNGEDDSPQWGKNAWTIIQKAAKPLVKPPAPKPN